jgi:hypothetical protein
VLGVRRLGMRRREKEGSSKRGAERRRRVVRFIGPGRRPAVVEFYSLSVSMELRGRRRRGCTVSVGGLKAA